MENEVIKLFYTVLNIWTETGLIMASDLQSHFIATPVLLLLGLSFSKPYISKAWVTQLAVRKYSQTINL